MSCCGKNDRLAKELEEKVNTTGKETIPLFLKIGLGIVGVGAIILYFL